MYTLNTTTDTCMYGEECWYPLIDLANRTILTESLCIVVFMIILVLGGITGNLIVIAVYRKHKKKTNAVLFILCLAYVDLMTVCLVHPYVIFKLFNSSDQNWEMLCKICEFGIHASLCVSVGILLTVSIDRYIAICWPLKYIYYQAFVSYVMIGCCVFGILLSSPIIVFYGKHDVIVTVADLSLHAYVCDINNVYQHSSSHHMFSSFMFFMFILVCSCLIIFYSCVARKAYIARRINPVSNDISQTSHKTVRSGLTNININLFTVATSETDMGNYNVRQMNRLVSTQIESDSSSPVISRLDQKIQKKEQELLAAKKIFPQKLKAAKILSLVTLVFILSWLPFWMMRLTSIGTGHEQEATKSYYHNVFKNFLSHLIYLNNAVNPVIYAIVHNTFRQDCLKMLKKCL